MAFFWYVILIPLLFLSAIIYIDRFKKLRGDVLNTGFLLAEWYIMCCSQSHNPKGETLKAPLKTIEGCPRMFLPAVRDFEKHKMLKT